MLNEKKLMNKSVDLFQFFSSNVIILYILNMHKNRLSVTVAEP